MNVNFSELWDLPTRRYVLTGQQIHRGGFALSLLQERAEMVLAEGASYTHDLVSFLVTGTPELHKQWLKFMLEVK
jgi:hypothetical protein